MDDVPPDLGQASQAKKKPYEAPRLETYGDVANITKAVAGTGMVLDGGTMVGMMKTS
jgi:hypothetical protein